MLTTLILLTLSTPSIPATAPAPAPPVVSLQDDEELPDKRPEIEEILDALKGHIGQRGREDTEAVALIDKLVQEFPQSGPKDRKSIVDGLGKCFDQTRKELDGGVLDNKLMIAAAVALGEMGESATKTIEKWIGNKKHRKDVALQRRLILSLGKTKDTDGIKTLLKLLDDKDSVIIGASAEALANFSEAPQKMRKDVFNELLKLLMTTKALMDGDAGDITSRERYDVVAAPIITTLQALTGHDERKPESWQRWWNKNKKKDWDEEE